LFSYLNHSLTAEGSDLSFYTRERGYNITLELNIICSETHQDGAANEQTITCRQFHASQLVGSQPMKREQKCIE